MISNLIASLQENNLDVTVEEIADILWLSLHMGSEASSSAHQVINRQKFRREELLFESSIAPALPDAPALAQALRPLKRQVPSRVKFLNEGAITQRIADTGPWAHVLNQAPTRLFEVALVIDGGTSMTIWRQTIAELRALLEHLGAFRVVRLWRLATDDQERVQVFTLPIQQVRSSQELIDPSGRRLLLVVTDCISPAWHSGKVQQILNVWGQRNQVTLIQVLPQQLWSRTALGMVTPVRLHASSPGIPNKQLNVRKFHYWDDEDEESQQRIAIPIVTLQPESFASWAQAITGTEGTWTGGVVFDQNVTDEMDEDALDGPSLKDERGSAVQRLQRFRAVASPIAWRLVGFLAAVPISLPMIRLIQKTLLPESRQVHVAEVLLSGLLEVNSQNKDTNDPDDVEYDFIAGVRELLLDSLPPSESLRVLFEVSFFGVSRYGQSLGFQEDVFKPTPALNALSRGWKSTSATEYLPQNQAMDDRVLPDGAPPPPNLPIGSPMAASDGAYEDHPVEKAVLPSLEEDQAKVLSISTPRYADLAFYYDYDAREAGNKILDQYALRSEQWYRLEVAVRGKPIGIPFEGQERYPIREPKQQLDVTIMVTAEGEGFEIEEPVRTLILPPFGDSKENAQFRVRPLRQSTNRDDLAKIRVRLYYEFNLLEVAVIHAGVVGKFDDSTKSRLGLQKPVSFKQEWLEREYLDFDNIHPRAMHIDVSKQGEYFQFNFAFRNDTGKELVFTASSLLTATDLEDALMNVRKIWYDISLSETFTKQLEEDEEEFITHVTRLAEVGRNLWRLLFKRERASAIYKIGAWLEKHPLKLGGLIQVSFQKNAANFVFPWALLYDRSIPRKKGEYPNPEGFWGVRYCIEQRLPNLASGTDEAVQIVERLKLGFMLWAQFRNVDKQRSLMDTLEQQSAGKLTISSPPITEAEACYEFLRDCDAHILYFYTHGYTRHREADIGVGPNLDLFIRWYERLDKDSPLHNTFQKLYQSVRLGQFEPDRSWIELTYGKIYLDELYDYEVYLQAGPLVFLNMCESAQITPSLSDSFVQFFLDRGARGVIGTECPMTIEFAHPFAERLLRGMLQGEQVGTTLLNARRHFMQLKNPLGLAYTLFGSATVCFEPPSLPMVPTDAIA